MSADQPISSVIDVVESCLCADNFSSGYAYLRGLAALLAGQAPSPHQVTLCRYLMQYDQDVYELVEQVAIANAKSLEQVLEQVITRLSVIYEDHDEV